MKQVKVKTKCASCGKRGTINVDLADLQMWQSGASFIQDAMPYLTQQEREYLMTGLCADCYPEEDYKPEQLGEEYDNWLDGVNKS